jgi:hypothetical protein
MLRREGFVVNRKRVPGSIAPTASHKQVLQTVRLHHDEISALLGLAQSPYNAGQRARKHSDGILQSCRRHRQ